MYTSFMKRKLHKMIFCLALAIIVILFSQKTYASLGGSPDSIASDKKALLAIRSTTNTFNKYTIHEFHSGPNTVREYVSSSGVVFGVAWNGLIHPDLTLLLGSYATEHQRALSHVVHHPGRRYFKIKTDNMVVEKWGHMRNLRGRAYVPALIPQEISTDEIK